MSTIPNMPEYKCHKKVWALKIKSISSLLETKENKPNQTALITPVETAYPSFKVSADYIKKHQPHEGGYFVQYEDGYQSFSPAIPFEQGYTKLNDTLTFGEAIQALKDGKKVARKGWNGKDMFLFLLPAGTIPKSAIYDQKLKEVLEKNGKDSFEALGSIRMKTADDKILTGWLASQTDMLQEDWVIVD